MSFTAITGCDKTVGVTADVGMTINRDNVELTTAGAGYRLNTVNSRHTPAARGSFYSLPAPTPCSLRVTMINTDCSVYIRCIYFVTVVR